MMSAAPSAFSPRRPALFLATMAVVAACGGTTEVAPPAKDVVPATITAVSSDTIRAAVGATASPALSVIVRNKTGELLDTVLVTFAVVTGNGALSNVSIRTNASGQASTTWTLGSTVGLQTVTATAGSLAPIVFRALASAGPAATITKAAGDNQSAAINSNVAIAPSVKIADQFGNPVAGVSVTFTAVTGGGLANGGSATTDANGVATVGSWRLGAIGANTLTAVAGSLTTTFTATATPGAAATLTLTPSTIGDLVTGAVQQLTTRVTDFAGNVLPGAVVAYVSANTAVASVSLTGLITAVGPGTTSVSATSGAATASVALSVIGHPATLTPQANPIDLATIPPGPIVFSKSSMVISIPAQQKLLIYDATGTTQTGTVPVAGISAVVAPARANGPVIVVNSSSTSRVWFIDPVAATMLDSLDIGEIVTSTAITSDGLRAYAMLNDGSLVVIDAATRTQLTRITLGGGVSRVAVAPGDTLLYAFTNVGVIFEMDLRTNVARQRVANITGTDIVIGPNGLIYVLDGGTGSIRLYDPTTLAVVRSVSASASAMNMAVSPDAQQIWVTHSNPLQVTIYGGSAAAGYFSVGSFSTGLALATRVTFSPTGSFAAIGNLAGRVDIVR